jgi:hypothetical protein
MLNSLVTKNTFVFLSYCHFTVLTRWDRTGACHSLGLADPNLSLWRIIVLLDLLKQVGILWSGQQSWSPSEEKWDDSVIRAEETRIHTVGNSIERLSTDIERRHKRLPKTLGGISVVTLMTYQGHLEQRFPTAGPRPSTGPWHQLYQAARGKYFIVEIFWGE